MAKKGEEKLAEPVMIDPTDGKADFEVRLTRPATDKTSDQSLWSTIRAATDAIDFESYKAFIDSVMCDHGADAEGVSKGSGVTAQRLPFPGVDRYNLLKTATEVFMMSSCGVLSDIWNRKYDGSVDETFFSKSEESERYSTNVTWAEISDRWHDYLERIHTTNGTLLSDESNRVKTLPYLAIIRRKLSDIPVKMDQEERDLADNCYGLLQSKLESPCFIELIWSYWHEEGLLVQAMNAVSMRFQNKRQGKGKDPLAHLDVGPLRPLNNLLWGYIQDEQHRLTIPRRAYEYDHHYGLHMIGRAVPQINSVDSRSKFIESFHNLLNTCCVYFKEDDDTTKIADAFPLLNALKEVHLLLAEGAHNQYGDLPWNARQEMLIQQWLLARPEMREFLNGRVMVPHSEEWMPRVEAMKKLMDWGDTPISSFTTLAKFGEKLLLSIRFGAWTDTHSRSSADNWARYWRSEIQGYIHAYRVATGVDLSKAVDDGMPSQYLLKRETSAKKRA